MDAQSPSQQQGQNMQRAPREVGPLLGLGIFFVPQLFSWFTLRSGHSKLARGLAFGWLGFLVLIALAARQLEVPPQATPSTTQEGR